MECATESLTPFGHYEGAPTVWFTYHVPSQHFNRTRVESHKRTMLFTILCMSKCHNTSYTTTACAALLLIFPRTASIVNNSYQLPPPGFPLSFLQTILNNRHFSRLDFPLHYPEGVPNDFWIKESQWNFDWTLYDHLMLAVWISGYLDFHVEIWANPASMQPNISCVRYTEWVSNFNKSSAVVELDQSVGQRGDGFMFSFLGSSPDTVTYLCFSCVPVSEPFPELKLAPVHQLFLCHLNSPLQLSLTLSIRETAHSCNHNIPVLCFLCVHSTSSVAKWSTFVIHKVAHSFLSKIQQIDTLLNLAVHTEHNSKNLPVHFCKDFLAMDQA